jgi:hypothetical protein
MLSSITSRFSAAYRGQVGSLRAVCGQNGEQREANACCTNPSPPPKLSRALRRACVMQSGRSPVCSNWSCHRTSASGERGRAIPAYAAYAKLMGPEIFTRETCGPEPLGSGAGWPVLPGFCRVGRAELAVGISAGHFPHHHGITRVALGVVKLNLSGLATERAPSRDRPRDHFQDETPGAGHVDSERSRAAL